MFVVHDGRAKERHSGRIRTDSIHPGSGALEGFARARWTPTNPVDAAVRATVFQLRARSRDSCGHYPIAIFPRGTLRVSHPSRRPTTRALADLASGSNRAGVPIWMEAGRARRTQTGMGCPRSCPRMLYFPSHIRI